MTALSSATWQSWGRRRWARYTKSIGRPTPSAWKGHDDLPVSFPPGAIAGLTVLYDSDQQRYVVVAATSDGKTRYSGNRAPPAWKGDDDLGVDFGPGAIVSVAGLYDESRKRFVVAVGTTDGSVHQVYWKAATVGIEAQSSVTQFGVDAIAALTGFYSASDTVDHLVVALRDGSIRQLWVTPDI